MARNNGRQAVRKRSGGGTPTMIWILIGILIGALAVTLLLRRSQLPIAPLVPTTNPQATAAAPSGGGMAPATSASAAKKPQYDFYSVLSEREVRIPDAEIRAQAKAEQQAQQKQQQAQQAAIPVQAVPVQPSSSSANLSNPATAVKETIAAAPVIAIPPQPKAATGYLLQLGAFPNAADAEALKARVAMQGMMASVQNVKVGEQTFHRVRLGPYHSATELEAARHQLADAGIKAIALKEGH